MMIQPTTWGAAWAALNVFALLALLLERLVLARKRRLASGVPGRWDAPMPAGESAAARLPKSLAALVEDAERSDSATTTGRVRGEARLAADLDLWRRRTASGGVLPQAADPCRVPARHPAHAAGSAAGARRKSTPS